jgi:hypothetical protein
VNFDQEDKMKKIEKKKEFPSSIPNVFKNTYSLKNCHKIGRKEEKSVHYLSISFHCCNVRIPFDNEFLVSSAVELIVFIFPPKCSTDTHSTTFVIIITNSSTSLSTLNAHIYDYACNKHKFLI